MLVADTRVAGVAFTGSTEVARLINRALAAKDGPIPPLIAETGGINAMIVDATALPEQVTDDVIASAFRSAGQRCSALRLLCVQDDVAERVLAMVDGRRARIAARRSARSGDPCRPGDRRRGQGQARALDRRHGGAAPLRFRWDGRRCRTQGTYVAPAIIELDSARELTEEVFGPVLHVVRWRAGELDAPARRHRRQRHRADPRHPYRASTPTVARIVARLAARQCLRQPQHDRRGGRHRSRSAAAACPAPARRPAGRTICAGWRLDRWSRSTPPPPAAMPRCWPRTSDRLLRCNRAAVCRNGFPSA